VKVLMLGWEFPPCFAGGVGVVARALARALVQRGADVHYLMPHGPEGGARVFEEGGAGGARGTLRVAGLPSGLPRLAYFAGAGAAATATAVPGEPRAASSHALYGPDLLLEVDTFARRAVELAARERLEFDVIHAHDWTTFRAGLALRRATGRPLVVHVHITEFDKSGGAHADPRVFALEREGLQAADRVVAVSHRVRDRCALSYGADPARLHVVYNAVEPDASPAAPLALGDPVVLFLGRVTLQKGPEYFVEAARRVLELEPRVAFVLAGNGDMLPRMIERAAELGIGSRMLFPGFVDRERAAALYASADVFVMPSVSEPFGIVPLEAMDRGVPVVVSRQSGVSELLQNALKVDFWDVDDLAGKIVAALRYPSLAGELRERGKAEVARLTWSGVAERLEALYREVIRA
jgi:glycosyltransferase involved in cell wall biosynthesis